MRIRSLLIPAAAVGLVATVPPITDDDDGATTRESGSVVIIGPPPPGGGASVSAIGTGCTTRGATTKLPTENIVIDIDAGAIEVPEIGAGVNRIVVRNFDSVPHGLVLTEVDSVADLPLTDDGFVDEDALPNEVFRIAEFPGNTICEGTFELPPGNYVVFSPSPEDRSSVEAGTESDVEAGLVTPIVIADSGAEAVGSATSSPGSTAPAATDSTNPG